MTAHFKFSIETFSIVHKILPLAKPSAAVITRNLEYRAFNLLGTIHILHRQGQLENGNHFLFSTLHLNVHSVSYVYAVLPFYDVKCLCSGGRE